MKLWIISINNKMLNFDYFNASHIYIWPSRLNNGTFDAINRWEDFKVDSPQERSLKAAGCTTATLQHTHTKSGVMLATLVGLNKAVVTVTSAGRLWTLSCSSSSCLLQFGLEGDHILWKGHHAVFNVFDWMCWKSCSSSNGHTRAAPVNQDDDGIKTTTKS